MREPSEKKKVYKIDGRNFDDFVGFIEACNHSFIIQFHGNWNGNLDSFSDYLVWPERPYILRWENVLKSQVDLGHQAMALWLSNNLKVCHASNRANVRKRLGAARRSEGQTLFELIVEIIEEKSPSVILDLKAGVSH